MPTIREQPDTTVLEPHHHAATAQLPRLHTIDDDIAVLRRRRALRRHRMWMAAAVIGDVVILVAVGAAVGLVATLAVTS